MNKIKRIGMVAVLTLALSLGTAGVADAGLTLGSTSVTSAGALALTAATASAGIDITVASTDADAIDIVADTVTGGDVFDINTAAITTGDVFDLSLPNTRSTGGVMKIIDAGATGTATGDLFQIDVTGTPDGNTIDIDFSGIAPGNAVDVTYGTAAATGNAVDLNMGTNLAGNAVNINVAGVRTAPVIVIDGTNTDGGADDHVIDINQSGQLDSNVLDITYSSAASTGNAVQVTSGTNLAGDSVALVGTGERTGNQIDITTDETGAGPIIDINVNGIKASGGNIIDVDYVDTTDIVADVINVTLNDALGAGALVVDAADGARSDAIIDITTATTGSAADAASIIQVNASGTLNAAANVLDINITGNAASNAIEITFDTGIATGGGIFIDNDTDVAGNMVYIDSDADRVGGSLIKLDDAADDTASAPTVDIDVAGAADVSAVELTSAGIGASGKAVGIDIATTGALAAGADVVQISHGTADLSSTSNLLALEVSTAAAGAYALYVNALDDSEAIKVDEGDVLFDEQFEVTGNTTLTGTLTVNGATMKGDGATKVSGFVKDHTLSTADLILTAADCGSVHTLATDNKTYTLPPTVAGCEFTFINTGADDAVLLNIDPDDADKIFGTVTLASTVVEIAAADGEIVLNTKSGHVLGDSMTLMSDGLHGWVITSSTGIWAEATP